MTLQRGPRRTGATPGVTAPELSGALILYLSAPRTPEAEPEELVQDPLPGMEPDAPEAGA